jgi:hypothetical protein
VIAREPRHCKLTVCNKTADRVMTFRYLGANITSNRSLEEDASINDQRSYDAWLRDIIWRNRYMSLRSRIRIYTT